MKRYDVIDRHGCRIDGFCSRQTAESVATARTNVAPNGAPYTVIEEEDTPADYIARHFTFVVVGGK
jgi:hypothetical protein